MILFRFIPPSFAFGSRVLPQADRFTQLVAAWHQLLAYHLTAVSDVPQERPEHRTLIFRSRSFS